MGTFEILLLSAGFFWSLTYILIIWKGFQEKTYCMPLVALCANLSWEFIFSFIFPHQPLQQAVVLIWLLLDLVIAFQFLKYGQQEFPEIPKYLFYGTFLVTLATSFSAILFICYELEDFKGVYAAFGQNFMMSVLFIGMLYWRKSLRGQSIWIALFKMLGTLSASAKHYLYVDVAQGSKLLSFLYVSIFIYDLIYLIMVGIQMRKEQESVILYEAGNP